MRDILKQESMALVTQTQRGPRSHSGKLPQPQVLKAGSSYLGPSRVGILGQDCEVGSMPLLWWLREGAWGGGITAGGGTPHPPSFSGSRQGFPPSSGGHGILSCSPKGVGGLEARPHGGLGTRSEESPDQRSTITWPGPSGWSRAAGQGNLQQPCRGTDPMGAGPGSQGRVTAIVTSSWARGSAPRTSHVSSCLLLKEPQEVRTVRTPPGK